MKQKFHKQNLFLVYMICPDIFSIKAIKIFYAISLKNIVCNPIIYIRSEVKRMVI